MIPAGVWRSDAYGWLLEIGDEVWTRWQLVGDGAYAEERGPVADLEIGFDRVAITRDPGGEAARLTLHHAGEITPYSFTRENGLPPACGREYRSDDPLATFDALAAIFHDHYAFFAERGLDWDAACASARARLDSSTPPDRLFEVATELLAPLEDNHVTLDTRPERSLFDREGSTPPGSPRAWKCDRIAALRASIARDLGVDSRGEDFWAAARAMQRVVAEDLLRGRGEEACNGFLHWGEIAPGIGYLALLRLFGFAATDEARFAADLPRDRVAGARFLAADRAALRVSLDRAFETLRSTPTLIVDLRMNGGGFDALALDFAARLADRERLAFTKAPVCRGHVVERAEIRVAPDGEPWAPSRPLFVLTSRRTGSAAEILVLALSSMPHTTRIGEPTLGILSDNLYKRLPNGWEVGLSNERYEAPGGELYEGIGIPPHETAEVWVEGDLRRGYRRALDAALAMASAR